MYVLKPCELENLKNMQCADFHFVVWLHPSVRKVTVENWVPKSKSKIATVIYVYAN